MKSELAKTFDPAKIEAKWYKHWEDKGLFRPHRPEAEPFTLVNPPPNVTGSLHIGHALDNTLQDVVVRYERLRGKDALWVVGTDHAGIATQMVVERQLAERQDQRTNHSREAFVELVWKWKAESGGEITRQLRRLGCSMDWSREQFTMDPHFTRAVTKVFVDLYNEGLIYRDKRLVNWDPMLKTAISDLEVETQEIPGHFWHFRYPLADGVKLPDGHEYIEVATTRPETMLADMAVAVHPEDARYRNVIGKQIKLPLTGRLVPVVADEHADPELGSGAVKITPGHDFNDFEVGKRIGIAPGEMLNMFDAEARVVQTADGKIPAELVGMDRFEARLRVVELLEEAGLLGEIEERVIPTPFGDRGGVVIEPWLTDQWYVDAATLAGPAMEAVRSGAVEIVPKSWEKTFFNWMENIQPWCISRQLWWGHRIPAWYGPNFNDPESTVIFVAEEDELAVKVVEYRLQNGPEMLGVKLRIADSEAEARGWMSGEIEDPVDPSNKSQIYAVWRDPDVLDTWFSSALWPFATLGWPEKPSPLQGRGRSAEGAEGVGATSPHDAAIGDGPHPIPSPEGEGLETSPSLLQRHYPNDLLISGFDILFFWDARMMMQGIHFMKDVPWRRLYLHGLVRAADGQKMSKSKGNVVDPLILIDKYGADALRFFMAAMESQGRDIKMDESRVEGYRNFATKLWNATRFCQANGIGASSGVAAPEATLAVNKWIIGEVVETVAALDQAMTELRFDNAAGTIYHFVWDRFCDWYLELVKPLINPPRNGEVADAKRLTEGAHLSASNAPAGEVGPLHHPADGPPPRSGEDLVAETRAVAGWVLDQILVMLHPFMPFVTEELWHAQGERPYELVVAKWPEPKAVVDAEAKAEIDWLIRLVSAIRAGRNELNVPQGQRLSGFLEAPEPTTEELLIRNQDAIIRLAKVSWNKGKYLRRPDPTLRVSAGRAELVMDLGGAIDIAAEKARLAKALEASQKEAAALAARLANPAFIERAKPEAVDKARADHAHHAAEAERLAAALARLG